MAFAKGQSGNPSGRRRGSSNKITHTVKVAITEALNDGPGAVAFFKKLKNGSADDRRCFANICARLVPHEMAGPNGEPLIPQAEPDLLEMARQVAFLLKLATLELDESEGQGSRLSQKS